MSRIVLMFLLLTSISISSHAQFNLKIGYEAAFIQSNQNARLVDGFNQKNSTILAQGKELSTLGLNNGLVIGVMYRFEASRISLNWHSTSSRHRAFGETTNPQMSFERALRYRVSGIGIQYEMLIGRLSLGFGAGRDVFRMTSLIDGSSNDKTILNEPELNVRFNLGYKLLNTERVSVILEPFFTFVAGELDHGPAFPFLEVDAGGVSTTDRPHYFGLQLLFYNGKQN